MLTRFDAVRLLALLFFAVLLFGCNNPTGSNNMPETIPLTIEVIGGGEGLSIALLN